MGKTTDLSAGFEGAKLVTPTALVLDPDTPYDRWLEMAPFLGAVHSASPWWIGDWCLHGEAAYGEKYAQAMNDTGLDYQTLANYTHVARHVPRSRRRASLGFTTHALVAKLPPDEQKKWLALAVENKWTRSSLRAALMGEDPRPGLPVGNGEVVNDFRSAARVVWIAAKRNGDHVEVPIEPWEVFVEAGGWEG